MTPPRPTSHLDLVRQAIRLIESGQAKPAERILKAVLRDDPDQYDALLALGVLCGQRQDLAGAVRHLTRAVRRRPQSGEALYNLGQALIGLQRHAEAAEVLARAVAVADLPHVHEKLADCLVKLGRLAEAIGHYRRTVTLAPGNALAASSAVEAMRKTCDWRGLEELERGLIGAVQAGGPVEPLLLQHVCDDPALQRRAAESYWRQMIAPTAPVPIALAPRAREGRLRIGYLSGDFRRHPMASVIAEMIELHDRTRFEVLGFSYGGDDKSQERRRMSAAFDRFIDVRALSDGQVVKQIAQSGIDILIDLAGYTAGARLAVVAARPAPVVCHYMGFPGTLGTRAYDYLIADSVVAPAGAERYFSEALARLPDCYWGVDRQRAIAAPTPSRKDYGLPAAGTVLCSFNGQQKLSPLLLDVWARVVAAVPDAVLWLYRDDEAATENLQMEAAARGLLPDRLVFAGRVPPDQHLARIPLADLILDTLPYGGHTTTCDALWMGVPVLTVEGHSFCSRVGSSLLRAAGAPELILPTLETYEREAIALARDPVRLAGLRSRLHAGRETCKLFDTPGFTRAMEAAFLHMADRHHRGEKPATFTAEPT